MKPKYLVFGMTEFNGKTDFIVEPVSSKEVGERRVSYYKSSPIVYEVSLICE